MIATSPTSDVGHLALVKAYTFADASLFAGVDYARLPFAVLFEWLLFGEASSFWTWLGAHLIFLIFLRDEARNEG